MQSDYLIEFVTIAREGSLARASRALNSSQSTLSRHLKALEKSLDMELLERRSDGVVLTDAGTYVFNRAGDMVDALDDIAFYARHRSTSRVVTIAGMTIFPSVMGKVEHLAAEHAGGVRYKVLPPGSFADAEIAELLDTRQADVYLTMSTDERLDALDGRYDIVEAFRTPVVAVMQRTHPLAKSGTLEPHNLDGCLLLHAQTSFDGERINWADTRRALLKLGVDYRSKTCTLRDSSDLMSNLKSGVILLPEAYEGVTMLRNTGRAVIPVHGIVKRLVAVCRTGSAMAEVISSLELGTLP